MFDKICYAVYILDEKGNPFDTVAEFQTEEKAIAWKYNQDNPSEYAILKITEEWLY